jgi:hypothetical protein
VWAGVWQPQESSEARADSHLPDMQPVACNWKQGCRLG